jgi:hypothetical protein
MYIRRCFSIRSYRYGSLELEDEEDAKVVRQELKMIVWTRGNEVVTNYHVHKANQSQRVPARYEDNPQ